MLELSFDLFLLRVEYSGRLLVTNESEVGFPVGLKVGARGKLLNLS